MKLLLFEGYSEVYGARELERVFDRRIATPLGKKMLENAYPPGTVVQIDDEDGELTFST
jgi:ATP-dependent Clp protease ATP-binding subunit ClpA